MSSMGDGYASVMEKMKGMSRNEIIKKAAEAKRSQKEALVKIRGNPSNCATIMKSNRRYAEMKVHNPVIPSEVKRAVGDNFYRIDFTKDDIEYILYYTNMGKENRLAKRIFGRPFRGNVLIVGAGETANLTEVSKWDHVSLVKNEGESSFLQEASTPITSSSSAESDSSLEEETEDIVINQDALSDVHPYED